MATHTIRQFSDIHPRDFHPDWALNHRTATIPDLKYLMARIGSLIRHGWLASETLVMFELSAKERNRYQQTRSDHIKFLRERNESNEITVGSGEDKKQVLLTSSQLADVLEELWSDDEGNIVGPKYAINAGFSRALAIPWTIAVQKAMNLESLKDIHGQLRHYDDEIDRLTDQVMENTKNSIATRKPKFIEFFSLYLTMVKAGIKQIDLVRRAGLKPNEAQRVFPLCQLILAKPEYQILERLGMGTVKYQSINKTSATKLRDLVADGNAPTFERAWEILTEGYNPVPPVMSPTEINNLLLVNGKCHVINMILQAIKTNDTSKMKILFDTEVQSVLNDAIQPFFPLNSSAAPESNPFTETEVEAETVS